METPPIERYIEASFYLMNIFELATYYNDDQFLYWSGIKNPSKDNQLRLTVDDVIHIMHNNLGRKWITKEMVEKIIEVGMNGCSPLSQMYRVVNKKKDIKVLTYRLHYGRG